MLAHSLAKSQSVSSEAIICCPIQQLEQISTRFNPSHYWRCSRLRCISALAYRLYFWPHAKASGRYFLGLPHWQGRSSWGWEFLELGTRPWQTAVLDHLLFGCSQTICATLALRVFQRDLCNTCSYAIHSTINDCRSTVTVCWDLNFEKNSFRCLY